VVGLAFLLAGIARFVTARHGHLLAVAVANSATRTVREGSGFWRRNPFVKGLESNPRSFRTVSIEECAVAVCARFFGDFIK
jgi:hypothetical protein